MSKTFENKVVLITGGTSGIGRATAIAFAREGAKVVISGRRKLEGAETVTLVEKAGGRGLFVQSDVSDEAQVKSLIEAVVREFGRLDVAFNNAGIEGTPAPLTEATEAQYGKVFDINVKGVFLSMKHEIPALLKSGGGSIVNTSSVAGSVGLPSMGLYVATKHAVNGLTKVAALELARQGIRVNTLAPDYVGEAWDSATARQDLAATVAWLGSPASGLMSGETILLNQGRSLQMALAARR